jgi:hypothetical protein
VARKNAQTFKAAGVEVMEGGTKECSEESGKDLVNPRWMVIQLTEKLVF